MLKPGESTIPALISRSPPPQCNSNCKKKKKEAVILVCPETLLYFGLMAQPLKSFIKDQQKEVSVTFSCLSELM